MSKVQLIDRLGCEPNIIGTIHVTTSHVIFKADDSAREFWVRSLLLQKTGLYLSTGGILMQVAIAETFVKVVYLCWHQGASFHPPPSLHPFLLTRTWRKSAENEEVRYFPFFCKVIQSVKICLPLAC